MPIPAKGLKILRDLDRITETAADELLATSSEIAPILERKIMSKIREMAAGPDGLKLTKANIKKLAALEREINDIIRNPKYTKAAQKYLDQFPIIDDLTIKANLAVNSLTVSESTFSAIKNHSLKLFESNLLGKGFESGVVDPLFQKISNLVLTGSDFGDIEKEITEFMGSRQGFESHVRQISVDSINQYQGAINDRVGKEFGLNWVSYIGSIIKTSRGQCAKWVSKRYIHRSEIQKEINFALSGGTFAGKKISGMIPSTTVSSFTINRGGFGCLHTAFWVADAIVPKEVRDSVPDPS